MASVYSTTGTHSTGRMGNRSGSLNTKSQRAQSRNRMSTRPAPSSGITAPRKAFEPVLNRSSKEVPATKVRPWKTKT